MISKSSATFTVEYYNDASKGGTFKLHDPKGQFSFEARSSSGKAAAANNPYTQQIKDLGVIPSGVWYISSITDKQKMKFELTPSASVYNPNYRNKFRIHGYSTTPNDASTGCIILEPGYRDKIMKAFLRDGIIELKIENKVY